MRKKKQPKKSKKLPTPEFDSERETRVLLEAMRSDIKTVAEGHSLLVKGQEEIKSRLGTVESELGAVKSELGTVKSEVETVKQAVLENSGRLGRVETRFENVEKKLDKNLANHGIRIVRLEEKAGV